MRMKISMLLLMMIFLFADDDGDDEEEEGDFEGNDKHDDADDEDDDDNDDTNLFRPIILILNYFSSKYVPEYQWKIFVFVRCSTSSAVKTAHKNGL